MIKRLNFLALLCVALFGLCSCSDDNNNGIEIGSYGYLIVNGAKWEVGVSAPNYSDYGYCFWSLKPAHIAGFMSDDKIMANVAAGDDVTAPELEFGTENALYRHVSGSVKVVKISGSDVTLKFNDYKVVYAGKLFDFREDEREKDLVDVLTFSGTVEFVLNK